MARELFYRQCVLTQPCEAGETRLVTWIPERGNGIELKPGCTLVVRDYHTGEPMPGRFTVESVGTEKRPEAEVKERAHNWKKYREATDV
jgi:hypothetical protein